MIEKLLKILKKISEIIARNNDYEKVLNKIVILLAESLKVDVCSIYTYNKNNDSLVLHASIGLKKDGSLPISMKNGEGLTGRSFKTRKILNIKDPAQHPNFKFFADSGEKRYKSFLSVPLTVGGECVGIVVIQKFNSERFNSQITDMVKSLSTQLGNLILNTQIIKALNNKSSTNIIKKKKISFLTVSGMPANDGIAKGKAYIFKSRSSFAEISHKEHQNEKKELELFDKAIELSIQKTLDLEHKAMTLISEIDASIFNVHLLFLEDKVLLNMIKDEIIKYKYSVEFSIKLVFTEYEKRFTRLDNDVFRDKIMDIKDTLLRLIEAVKELRLGEHNSLHFTNISYPRILVAKELLPSDLIRMPIDNISGIICEKGGITAHVAILAKALGIPALLGVKKIVKNVQKYDEILLDCYSGLAYIRPDKAIKERFREISKENLSEENIDSGPALTNDGQKITLRGNISLVCEIDKLVKYGAEGIGLYRTEFLYMIRDHLPSEDEQFNVYSKIFKAANNNSVTIRTLDCGSDKPIPYFSDEKEENPALGNRGVRLLLSKKNMFITHIRAILRAAIYGKLKLNFPMVTSIDEINQIRIIIKEAEESLHKDETEHSKDYKIGIMVEVPAVAFNLEKFIKNIDFISIGTNDLLQYIYAADRGNDTVNYLSDFFEPFFLKLLQNIGKTMQLFPDKELSLCGEIASNPKAIPFLIGAGIYDLSITVRVIPKIKKVVNLFSIKECQDLLQQAIEMDNAIETKKLIENAITIASS